MNFILFVLVEREFLDMHTTRALAFTCRDAYVVARPLLEAYKTVDSVLHPLLPLLPDIKRSTFLHYSALTDITSPCWLLSDDFWDAVMPPHMTRLQHAIYFAVLMAVYPCLDARIVDNDIPWSCAISPDSMHVKHLPTLSGSLYYCCESSTILKLYVNFKTRKVRVEPREYEHRIDLDALYHLLDARTDTINASMFARRLKTFFYPMSCEHQPSHHNLACHGGESAAPAVVLAALWQQRGGGGVLASAERAGRAAHQP